MYCSERTELASCLWKSWQAPPLGPAGEFGAEVVLRGATGQFRISYDQLTAFSSQEYDLAQATLAWGRQIRDAQQDLNALPWSQWQQAMLHGNGLNVNVSEEETSVYQVAADAVVGCATDPVCVADVTWTSGAEIDWNHP